MPGSGGDRGESTSRINVVLLSSTLSDCVAFSSSRLVKEAGKSVKKGLRGPFWGICHGVSPSDCKSLISSSLDFDGNGKTDVGVYRSAGVVHKVVVRQRNNSASLGWRSAGYP